MAISLGIYPTCSDIPKWLQDTIYGYWKDNMSQSPGSPASIQAPPDWRQSLRSGPPTLPLPPSRWTARYRHRRSFQLVRPGGPGQNWLDGVMELSTLNGCVTNWTLKAKGQLRLSFRARKTSKNTGGFAKTVTKLFHQIDKVPLFHPRSHHHSFMTLQRLQICQAQGFLQFPARHVSVGMSHLSELGLWVGQLLPQGDGQKQRQHRRVVIQALNLHHGTMAMPWHIWRYPALPLTIPQQSHHIRAPLAGKSLGVSRKSSSLFVSGPGKASCEANQATWRWDLDEEGQKTRLDLPCTMKHLGCSCNYPRNLRPSTVTPLSRIPMSVPPDLGSLSKPIDGTSRQTHPPNPSNPTNETVTCPAATAQGNLVCLTPCQMKQFSVPDAQIAGIRESPEFGQGLIKGSRGSSVQNHRFNASEVLSFSSSLTVAVSTWRLQLLSGACPAGWS